MRRALHTITTPADAAIVVVICFGLSIVLSVHAMFAGFPDLPFTDAGFIHLMITEVVLAVIALTFLRVRNFDIRSLLPHPTLKGGLAGVGLFFGAWFAGILVTAPFAHSWAEQPIHRMMADANVSASVIVPLGMVNGAFEEVFLLGVLVRGLRAFGLSIAVGVPLLVRVLYHLYQGPLGALWVLAFGLVFSIYYVRSPTLWPPVFAHVLWDVVPFV